MKYRNKITYYDGRKFDSIKECERYKLLKMLEKCGKITNLECQKKYVLIPKQDNESQCSYYADFVYKLVRNGKTVVEDVKGVKTPVYKIKKKLMKYIYGIEIQEV